MIVAVLASELERRHLERALASYVHVQGRDGVPDGLNDLLAALSRHSTPLAANVLDIGDSGVHGALMTYTQTAARLEVSKRTVSRLVASGRLRSVGRRILTADVVALNADS